MAEFITLEKNNKLDQARKSPQGYDSMLQIDLKQFRTSEDFRDYLKKYDAVTDKTEAIFLGWLLALLTDIMLVVTQQLSHIPNRIKNIKIKHKTP